MDTIPAVALLHPNTPISRCGRQRPLLVWLQVNRCIRKQGVNGMSRTMNLFLRAMCVVMLLGVFLGGSPIRTGAEDTYAPGRYDAYGDGCLYWWDGAQYTGDVDCNGDGYADEAATPAGWYDANGDGCLY